MINLLNDSPQKKLSGRLLYTTRNFVDLSDVIGKRILDVGCGFGWFEKWALENNVASIYGTEINDKNLETVKKINDKRLQLSISDSLTLPFQDNTFDTVVSWEVLEHLPKDHEDIMFSEVSRVLKPSGTFYLSTPNHNVVSYLLDPAWCLIGHRHYSIGKLSEFAYKSGFVIDKKETRGGLYEMTSMLNLYLCKWVFRRNMILEQWFKNKTTKEYQDNIHGFATLFIKLTNGKK